MQENGENGENDEEEVEAVDGAEVQTTDEHKQSEGDISAQVEERYLHAVYCDVAPGCCADMWICADHCY